MVRAQRHGQQVLVSLLLDEVGDCLYLDVFLVVSSADPAFEQDLLIAALEAFDLMVDVELILELGTSSGCIVLQIWSKSSVSSPEREKLKSLKLSWFIV